MGSLLLVLFAIAASDVLNPVLFASVAYALSTRRPYAAASTLLASYITVQYAVGIGIALGLDALIDLLGNPRPIDFVIEIAIGLALVFLAVRSLRSGNVPRRRELARPAELTVPYAVLLGAQVMVVGLPFALPYFAALDQILKADLAWLPSLLVLAYYNALYALPFAGLIVLRAVAGNRADAIMTRLNGWIEGGAAIVLPLILLALGLALIADGGGYFLGYPLFPLGS